MWAKMLHELRNNEDIRDAIKSSIGEGAWKSYEIEDLVSEECGIRVVSEDNSQVNALIDFFNQTLFFEVVGYTSEYDFNMNENAEIIQGDFLFLADVFERFDFDAWIDTYEFLAIRELRDPELDVPMMVSKFSHIPYLQGIMGSARLKKLFADLAKDGHILSMVKKQIVIESSWNDKAEQERAAARNQLQVKNLLPDSFDVKQTFKDINLEGIEISVNSDAKLVFSEKL